MFIVKPPPVNAAGRLCLKMHDTYLSPEQGGREQSAAGSGKLIKMPDETPGMLLCLELDFGKHLRVLPHLVRNSACADTAAPVHASELAGGMEVAKEILPVHSFCRGSSGVGNYKGFPMQLIARAAVRKAVQEGLLHPAVQQGGHGEPENGKLEYNHISPEKIFLFCSDIDVEIRVEPIEVDNAAPRQLISELFQNDVVGNRITGGVGVAGNDEDILHGWGLS